MNLSTLQNLKTLQNFFELHLQQFLKPHPLQHNH